MELKGATHEATGDGGGREDVQYQFSVEEALFSVVKVWDVESCVNDATDASEGKLICPLPPSLSHSPPAPLLSSLIICIDMCYTTSPFMIAKSDSLSAPDSTEGTCTSDSDDVDHKIDPSSIDFGSCVAAITINDRLMVIRTQHRSVDMCMYICTGA
ncbi:MAG: hypothetical protein MJE68_04355 [Proteobacteria bacterium]|nr:hypothetical protein [Pseudomonadota bacterium]